MKEYLELLNNVLTSGTDVETRNGKTQRLLGQSLALYNVQDHFPIITTRIIFYAGVFGEAAAFLRGATLTRFFEQFGCYYWSQNANQWKKSGREVGRIYGAQWREWENGTSRGLDQLTEVLQDFRTAPESRRHLVTAWNPAELHEMCLPPCHFAFQLHAEKHDGMSMTVYMRSVDVCLGLPSDMVLYGLLLTLFARDVGRYPCNLYFQFGDCHVYSNHVATAIKQLSREPQYSQVFPRLVLSPAYSHFETFIPQHANIIHYQPQGALSYDLNV